MKFEVSADLPINAADYFAERDSAAFRALMCKVLNLAQMEFKDVTVDPGTGTEIVRLETRPDMDQHVPKSVQRYITFELVFYDLITYRPEDTKGPSYKLLVKSEVPFFKPEQFKVNSEMTIEPVDGNNCKQSIKGEANIKISMIGGITERLIVNGLKTTYAALPEVVQRWVTFREKLAETPEGKEQLYSGRPEIKAFPQDALDVLKQPYKEIHIDEEEEEDAATQELSSQFRGKLRTESALYFDAEEVLKCDIVMDEVTRDAVIEDKLAVAGAIAAAGETIEVEVEVEDDDDESVAASDKSFHGLPQAYGKNKHEYNAALKTWRKFWDDVDVATAKVPDVAARLFAVAETTEKLGVLKVKVNKAVKSSLKALGGKNTSKKEKAESQKDMDGRDLARKSSIPGAAIASSLRHGMESMVSGIGAAGNTVVTGIGASGKTVVTGIGSGMGRMAIMTKTGVTKSISALTPAVLKTSSSKDFDDVPPTKPES